MPLQKHSWAPLFIRLAVPLGLVFLASSLLLSIHNLERDQRGPGSHLPAEIGPLVRYSARAALPSACSSRITLARLPVEHTLRRGETITQVLRGLGLSGADAHQAAGELAEHVRLRSVKAGNRYSALYNPDSTLAAVELTLADAGRMELTKSPPDAAAPAAASAWRFSWVPFRRSVELRAIHGTLDGAWPSLTAAIVRAGGPAALAYRVAEALRWDLDFSRDLRRGDRFEALYETTQLDGQDHGVGRLVAVTYDAGERRHEAYRFGDDDVFYDGGGRPLRQMFLRSPLPFTHVTSLFSQHRLHPVLGEVRPHNGVDYAAPVGTPVEATAGGVVVFTGWDGGGGNVVKVQHGTDYVTAYLHLSRFAPGIHPGRPVRQGEVIAYTGATGLVTGPHLDYRVQYRGSWVNPLSLSGKREEPIAPAELAAFRSWRDSLQSSLASGIVPAAMRLSGSGQGWTRLAGLSGSSPAAADASHASNTAKRAAAIATAK
jgi:murein DD-endopeptidase MepM/ murein hydrolase activator NlpD